MRILIEKKSQLEKDTDEAHRVLDQHFPDEQRRLGKQPPKPADVQITRMPNSADKGDPMRRNYIWMTAKMRNLLRTQPPPPMTYTFEVMRVKGSDGQLYIFERYHDFMIGGNKMRASTNWEQGSPLNKHGELEEKDFWNDRVFFNSYDKWHRF